jgi:peptidoglycan hydrolase-like protein with peptidoglycan-binding domain
VRAVAIAVGVALVAALTAVVAAAAIGLGGGKPAAEEKSGTLPAATAKVARRTLVDAATVDGKIVYGGTAPLVSAARGTATWLAPVGAVVTRGEPVLRADERPVPLFYGSVPLFRPLVEKAEGRDVRQLERNLRELGYGGFTADGLFSAATTKAVMRWQRDLDLPETGKIQVGEIIYAAGAVRVARHTVRVGASAAGELMSVTGTKKSVIAEAQVGEDAWAEPGTKVTVVLPEGPTVAGTVKGVAPAASSSDGDGTGEDDGQSTIRVTVEVRDQDRLSDRADAPVAVRYVLRQRKNVLTVPVAALLALAEGGYGLEVVDGGSTRVVAVELGLVSGGQVEVTGDVEAGMTVGMPA